MSCRRHAPLALLLMLGLMGCPSAPEARNEDGPPRLGYCEALTQLTAGMVDGFSKYRGDRYQRADPLSKAPRDYYEPTITLPDVHHSAIFYWRGLGDSGKNANWTAEFVVGRGETQRELEALVADHAERVRGCLEPEGWQVAPRGRSKTSVVGIRPGDDPKRPRGNHLTIASTGIEVWVRLKVPSQVGPPPVAAGERVPLLPRRTLATPVVAPRAGDPMCDFVAEARSQVTTGFAAWRGQRHVDKGFWGKQEWWDATRTMPGARGGGRILRRTSATSVRGFHLEYKLPESADERQRIDARNRLAERIGSCFGAGWVIDPSLNKRTIRQRGDNLGLFSAKFHAEVSNWTKELEVRFIVPQQLVKAQPRPKPRPVPPKPKPKPVIVDQPTPKSRVSDAVVRQCLSGVNGLLTREKIKFRTASSALRPESAGLLDQVAAKLKACRGSQPIAIEVHMDSMGNDKRNLELSQARARSVKTALAARGVPGSRLVPMGFGETRPIATNKTRAGRASNRRVVFNLAALAGVAKAPTVTFDDSSDKGGRDEIDWLLNRPSDSPACKLTKRIMKQAGSHFQAFKGARRESIKDIPTYWSTLGVPGAMKPEIKLVPLLAGDAWVFNYKGKRTNSEADAQRQRDQQAAAMARCLGGWKQVKSGKKRIILHRPGDPPVGGMFSKSPQKPYIALSTIRFIKSAYKGQTVWVPFVSGKAAPGDMHAYTVSYTSQLR